jgi:hypothetical protein
LGFACVHIKIVQTSHCYIHLQTIKTHTEGGNTHKKRNKQITKKKL